jgi:predicted aldo/keto reductase-like oxidoreductase
MEGVMTDKGSDLSRRRFISTSLAGIAAAGLTGLGHRPAGAQEEAAGKTEGTTVEKAAAEGAEKAEADIIYRDLGKTGIRLPIVSMGAMNSDNPELVKGSYDMGARHFDTASLYAFGRNEQMIGKVIKEMGVRDKVIIGTKERLAGRGGMSDADAKVKFIKLAEGSLKRLQTDYVDIVYIHSIGSAGELDDQASFAAMDQLKQDGKARATGVSTHQNMTEIINRVVEEDLCDVVLTSMNVSLADDTDFLEAIDRAAAKGIGLLAMKTQAGGRQLPNQNVFAQYESATIQKAMLKWVLRHESITTAIPGYTNYEHMNEDLSVMRNLEYAEDEKRFLADNELKMGLGFCHQCRLCVASCPHGVDVPTLMRTHMYAAQYSNFRQARAALDEIPPGRGIKVCGSCETCTARCANWVDIAYRIEDLKLMYA